MNSKARWIWNKRNGYKKYNDSILARKQFQVVSFRKAIIHITADTWYRLFINGIWLNDGPARAWPEHYSYDSIDITPWVKTGQNEIKIISRYFGVGDFHHIPQQAGLLANVEITSANGRIKTISTDSTWQVADYKPLIRQTPKVSMQMEPAEYFDATFEGKLKYKNATVLFSATEGPWKNLAKRKVPLLARKEVCLTKYISAVAVESPGDYWCLPFRNLFYDGLIEANGNVYTPFILTSVVDISKKTSVKFDISDSSGNRHNIYINSKTNKTNDFDLTPGKHVIMFVWNSLGHTTDVSFRFISDNNAKLINPLKPGMDNPWCFIPFMEYAFAGDNMQWQHYMSANPAHAEKVENFKKHSEKLLDQIKNINDVKSIFYDRARVLSSNKMFFRDNYHRFILQQHLPNYPVRIDNPSGLIYDNPDLTTVYPAGRSDVQLLYDLGQQTCGYYQIELTADKGVEIDIRCVEYITPSGKIQNTIGNRNGMTYITRKGKNCYISLKRRSGRYIFVTFRNIKHPICIRRLAIVESSYPVERQGSFSCSDNLLNRIWDISTRTLELCMEDAFTDCPLYEQTLWVGDARNESLFAYTIFDGSDIARNCIEITAQSLERYPLVGCQVPSSWDCILPAWSFLWGISVWEHYWYTGDFKWLRKIWPAVRENLDGAFTAIDEKGLFAADLWNLFDWADIDQGHNCVLHNSMFMVGAIDAAVQCAAALNENCSAKELINKRKKLVSAINKLWDKKQKFYPDSIHEDGTISPSNSQHTSFLSILYNIIPPSWRKDAIHNIIKPSPKTVRVGSPFAIMFMFEAMEKAGLYEEIIRTIRRDYAPMLELGATTVWESFARGTLGHDEFPTRSHCHAWSCAPVYFLSRIILGLRQTSAGCRSFELSPHPSYLHFANGSVTTPNGPISVKWQREGDKMNIIYQAPPEIKIQFRHNESLKGLSIKIQRIA